MNNKCEKCGGELIKGLMAGMHGVFFYPDGEINKLKPKRSLVIYLIGRQIFFLSSRGYCVL